MCTAKKWTTSQQSIVPMRLLFLGSIIHYTEIEQLVWANVCMYLPSFDEGNVEERSVKVHKLEEVHLYDKVVFVVGLCAVEL